MSLFGPPNIEKMKARRDVRGLIKALTYKKDSFTWKDLSVRRAAAEALGEIKDASVVEPLIAALRQGSIEAAGILGEIGDARAVKPLIAILQNDNRQEVRVSAAEALVAMYQSGKLNADSKQLILIHRTTIQRDNHADHSDEWNESSHYDGAYDKSSHPTHVDEISCSHEDTHADRHLTLDL